MKNIFSGKRVIVNNIFNDQIITKYTWLNGGKTGGDDDLFDDADMEELFSDKEKKIEIKLTENIDDIHIFPEDSINTFKQKIYAISGIPSYRQHLWCKVGNKIITLGYSVSINSPQTINITRISENTSDYEGLPVNINWYNSKDDIMVYEENGLLGDIYTKFKILEFYITDLNEYINPVRGKLEKIVKTDRYSLELIYYSFVVIYWPQLTLSVFAQYIIDEKELLSYPNLVLSNSVVQKKYILESKIINRIYNNPVKANVLEMGIVKCSVSISSSYVRTGTVVDIRNLFDSFVLSSIIPYTYCRVDNDGKLINLSKSFNRVVINKINIPVNCIAFVLKGFENDITLVIKHNGEYLVQSSWNAVSKLGFNEIYDIIKNHIHPLIDMINTYLRIKLVQINRGNAVFVDIDTTIYWKVDVTPSNFGKVIEQLDDYVKSDIINKAQVAGNVYYFLKGMNSYKKYESSTNNEFNYMVDDTYTTRLSYIGRQKSMELIHRFSDIQINMSGLRESEYLIFYNYINFFTQTIKLPKMVQVDGVKKLKALKESDPVLYDFKKMYDSPLIYARICQKPKQPVIHKTPGKDRTKFWNFTSKEPAYYECPNKKYPYLNFQTGVHPNGYCIPCCYKLQPPMTGKNAENFKQCVTKYEIKTEAASLNTSRYVTAYSKTIESGRLANLPDDSLLPLFYDTFSKNSEGIDAECGIGDGHFIFGAPQHIQSLSFIGAIFSISHALKMNIIQYVEKVIDSLRNNRETWNILLEGTIMNHFTTLDSLCDAINNTFMNNEFILFELWNELFIDITTKFMGYTVVLFIDSGEIYLHVPESIRYIGEYMINDKYIILIQKGNLYYPVYKLDKDQFHKNGKISNRIYLESDGVMNEIYNIVVHSLKNNTNELFDLFLIKLFIENSEYEIDTQYINNANLCYGVTIKGSSLIYLSINESRYIPDKTKITFDLYDKPYSSWSDMKNFMVSFNEFVNSHQESGFSPMSVEEWILYQPLNENTQNIIGFKSSGVSQWLKDISMDESKKIIDVKYSRVFYRPTEVNNAMLSERVIDDRVINLNESLYETHLYNLVVIHFRNVVYNTIDKSMRTKIKEAIKAPIDYEKLQRLLTEFPRDYNNIRRTLANTKNAVDIIEESRYDFDKKIFNSFKNLPHNELVSKLKEVFSDIVLDKKPMFKDSEFSNILSPCPSNNVYCDSKKLMITNDRLYPLLEILASDILNPLKSDIIADKVDYFKFIQRPNEHIIIEL